MKKLISIFLLVAVLFSFAGCGDLNETNAPSADSNTVTESNPENTVDNKDSSTSNEPQQNDANTEPDVEPEKPKKYAIGDEVTLAGIKFNVYKIEKDVLHLLAQKNVATCTFAYEVYYEQEHDYEGSKVEGFVNKFVDNLEDKGYSIKSYGIIDKGDLIDLGFDLDGLNGTKYKINNTLGFIEHEEHFWVDGYSKYDTYAWVYSNGILTTEKCADEYGVRPVIAIKSSEVNKEVPTIDLTIKEIVSSEGAWLSEGGIHNPYDRYYFDCDKMLFTNTFESSALSRKQEYNMKFIDDKTIQIDGLRSGDFKPAQITIVNETKLRVRYLDETHNTGDYFLVKE